MKNLKNILSTYKKNGVNIHEGEAVNSLTIKKVPTGIIMLDYLTSGGIPISKITSIQGAKASGKTTLALRISQTFLEHFPDKKVIYFDFEHTYNYEIWGKYFIKNIDNFILVNPPYGEVGVDIIGEVVKTDEVSLIIIDSIGAIVPMEEAEAEAGDSLVGHQAKLINRMWRKILPEMCKKEYTDSPLTVIAIPTITVDIGKKTAFGIPMKKVGGTWQDFLYSLDIKLYLEKKEISNGIPVKDVFNFTIEKNKYGLSKVSGKFVMDLINIGKLEQAKDYLILAKKHGLITSKGKKKLLYGVEFNTYDEIEITISESIELQQQLHKELLQQDIRGALNDNSNNNNEMSDM